MRSYFTFWVDGKKGYDGYIKDAYRINRRMAAFILVKKKKKQTHPPLWEI